MPATVYRKTDAGRAEVGRRQAGLAPGARQMLILVNGIDSLADLQAKRLSGVQEHLDSLLALGLIEPVPVSRTLRSPPPAEAAPVLVQAPPEVATAVQTEASAEEAQALLLLQRRAWQLLQPHFGPDAPVVAQALLAARTLADYHLALAGIEARLAIHLGRKRAGRDVHALRGPP